MTRGRRALVWTPALVVMAIIAWFSHQPRWPDAARGWPDWLLHGIAFGILAAALALGATDGARIRLGIARVAFVLLGASAYGVIDEWHQSLVPGRVASVSDWAMDTVGAALCVATLQALERWRRGGR